MSADTSVVPLNFLLVSKEEATRNAAQQAFAKLQGTIECVTSVAAASNYIKAQRIDGVILDIGVRASLEFITQLRKTRNARAFAFICVRNDAESAVALKGGANALLTVPVSSEAVFSIVSSFRSIMESERRRYHRHKVILPVVITLGGHTYQAIVENISQGGMAVRLPCLLPDSALVEFSFELDSGVTITGNARLKWENGESLAGMAFHRLAGGCKHQLIEWLTTLSDASLPEQKPMTISSKNS